MFCRRLRLIDSKAAAAKAIFAFTGQVEPGTVLCAVELRFIKDNGLFGLVAARLCDGHINSRADLSDHDTTLRQIPTHRF